MRMKPGHCMRKDESAQLHEIVKDLERGAAITAARGLHVTTKLLRMARLELLCQIHQISSGELRAIGDRLRRTQPGGDNGARRAAPLRPPH
jgi:hypothetical protein